MSVGDPAHEQRSAIRLTGTRPPGRSTRNCRTASSPPYDQKRTESVRSLLQRLNC